MDLFVAPPKQKSASHSKKVQFCSKKRWKSIRHFRDYSDEEHAATWYSIEQLLEVVADCVFTCRMMMNGDLVLEDEGFCSRGLEYKTPSGSQFRKENKAKAQEVVMSEMEVQRKTGFPEPEYLALVYACATKENRRLAHIMALRDQEEVLCMQKKETPELARTPTNKLRAPSPASPVSDSDNSDSSLETGKNVFFLDKNLLDKNPKRLQESIYTWKRCPGKQAA